MYHRHAWFCFPILSLRNIKLWFKGRKRKRSQSVNRFDKEMEVGNVSQEWSWNCWDFLDLQRFSRIFGQPQIFLETNSVTRLYFNCLLRTVVRTTLDNGDCVRASNDMASVQMIYYLCPGGFIWPGLSTKISQQFHKMNLLLRSKLQKYLAQMLNE